MTPTIRSTVIASRHDNCPKDWNAISTVGVAASSNEVPALLLLFTLEFRLNKPRKNKNKQKNISKNGTTSNIGGNSAGLVDTRKTIKTARHIPIALKIRPVFIYF